jgi:hypothetical protein
LLLRGSGEIGADGLLRFYLLHVVLLPLLGVLVLSAHYYRVARIHGISLPARVEEGELPPQALQEAKRKVDFLPDLLIHEILLISLGILILLVVTHFFYDAPLESHANPLRTPLETQAPWFFLWVQGMLKMGNTTTWGTIIPLAFLGLLLAVPYLDHNPSRLARKRPVAISLSVLVLAALVVLSYMGTESYGISLDKAISIVQEIIPEERSGELHFIPFDQLKVGIYQTGNVEAGSLPLQLAVVFNRFEQLIEEAEMNGDLPEAQAWLIVEERQANLKQITVRIQWIDINNQTSKTYERSDYLHRDHLDSWGETRAGNQVIPPASPPLTGFEPQNTYKERLRRDAASNR